jgi:hypothetical protein
MANGRVIPAFLFLAMACSCGSGARHFHFSHLRAPKRKTATDPAAVFKFKR